MVKSDCDSDDDDDSDEDSEDVVVMMREKRPQLFVALGKIDQPCASHSQAVQSARSQDRAVCDEIILEKSGGKCSGGGKCRKEVYVCQRSDLGG